MAEQYQSLNDMAIRGPIVQDYFQRINLELYTPEFSRALDRMFEWMNNSEWLMESVEPHHFTSKSKATVFSELISAICDYYNSIGWDKDGSDEYALYNDDFETLGQAYERVFGSYHIKG